jgi:hypothetical protein
MLTLDGVRSNQNPHPAWHPRMPPLGHQATRLLLFAPAKRTRMPSVKKGAWNMKNILSLPIIALVLLTGVVVAQERSEHSTQSDAVVKILNQCVSSMTPVDVKTRALIDKQKQQLKAIETSSHAQASGVEQPEPRLNDFFATGDELRQAFGSSQKSGAVSAAQYSPDPSYCANHCSQSCGYNSAGEKVCWYVCYRCCSNGGC